MTVCLRSYSLALLLFAFSLPLAQDLRQGDAAFLPELSDSYGIPIDLADIPATGGWVVFWFYPQAFTSGCSLQAKRYSDLAEDFTALGAKVFGVSADNAETQCEFVETLARNGQMIPDRDRVLANAYGVGGIFFDRDTVLINPEGKVEKIWRNVEPIEDADSVLEYLKAETAKD